MALLRNGTVLNQYPIRQIGGGVASDISMSGRGEQRNIYSGITDKKSGIPNGHVAPSSWLLPLKPGGMSSVNYAVATVSASASGTMGFPLTASTSFVLQLDGAGGLITSGTGTSSITFTITPSPLLASLSGVGTSSFTIDGTGLADGHGYADGITTLTVNGTVVSYAVGHMSGTTVDSSVLTVDTIAKGVWNALAVEYNLSDTMGEKLNNAASGGVDYDDLGNAVWSVLMSNMNTSGSAGEQLKKLLTTGKFIALK